MDRRIGVYVENVPASMTKCVFCRRHAHRAHFSPRLLVLKKQGGSGFGGSMEEENFITNLDTESKGLGELSGR